jgi:biopolymer transport protein ExbB/TolQ
MIELFYMGGPVFMGIITLTGLSMIVVAVVNGLPVLKGEVDELTTPKLRYIKEVGLLAMILGILSTLVGLYNAFAAIEQVRDISPAMLAGGLKVSLITILYGMITYVISILIWLGLSWKARQ